MEDLTGQVFADLTAVRPADYIKGKGTVWVWRCVCGNEVEIAANRVKKGHDLSCGCRRSRECATIKLCRHCGKQSFRKNRHGNFASVCQECYNAQTNDFKYRNPRTWMLQTAKRRARVQGVPFDLTYEDFEIPELCPVFGTPMFPGNGKMSDNSPSLDKIIPSLGYVKGNVAVISWKANRLKSNATAVEIRKLADWMDAQHAG